jgi:hypothetical protein
MKSVEMWNRMVGARQPKVGAVEALLGCSLANVYEHAPNFLCAHPNLLFRLPIGTSYQVETPAVSMTLILRAGYLSPDALIKPSELWNLAIFGIPLEGSATGAVDALERTRLFGIDLVTDANRWLIYCGKALALEFNALPHSGLPDPYRSEMVAVSYYFNIPYKGINHPIVQEHVS